MILRRFEWLTTVQHKNILSLIQIFTPPVVIFASGEDFESYTRNTILQLSKFYNINIIEINWKI